MRKYILIPISRSDPVEEILSRIEEVAEPGMTVIFLIPYQGNSFFENRRLKRELSAKGLATDPDALMRHGYEQQMRLADERISGARETLYKRAVKVLAYVYVGRLRPLLKRYKRNGSVYRVLMRQRKPISISGCLRGIAAFFSFFIRSGFFPYPYSCNKT